MALTLPQFYMLCEQINPIKKTEATLLLAIATNPHTESKVQGKLWTSLKDRSGQKKIQVVSQRNQASFERVQAELDKRKREADDGE